MQVSGLAVLFAWPLRSVQTPFASEGDLGDLDFLHRQYFVCVS